MLVLTRRKGEKVSIANGEIVVTFLEIRGDKIRLGCEAPKDIPINRDEVETAIDAAATAALAAAG